VKILKLFKHPSEQLTSAVKQLVKNSGEQAVVDIESTRQSLEEQRWVSTLIASVACKTDKQSNSTNDYSTVHVAIARCTT